MKKPRYVTSSDPPSLKKHVCFPAFKKAVDDSDSYAIYTIAKEEHSRSSSFAVAQSIFQQLLSVKMDGTFSKLVHDLTDHRRKFDAVFDNLGHDPDECPL